MIPTVEHWASPGGGTTVAAQTMSRPEQHSGTGDTGPAAPMDTDWEMKEPIHEKNQCQSQLSLQVAMPQDLSPYETALAAQYQALEGMTAVLLRPQESARGEV